MSTDIGCLRKRLHDLAAVYETFLGLVDSPSLADELRSGIPPVYGLRTIDDVVD